MVGLDAAVATLAIGWLAVQGATGRVRGSPWPASGPWRPGSWAPGGDGPPARASPGTQAVGIGLLAARLARGGRSAR
jgi:hypothetical protein